MIVIFGGHKFQLHCSGALFWPSESLLIVSDMHLEKGSHFARRGFFLPPYDSHETLSTLLGVCRDTGCNRLLLLGDAFHDEKGFYRLGRKEQAMFQSLLNYTPIWIKGNHDKDFVPEGFIGTSAYLHQGITFRHEAEPGAGPEISGHFHPKVSLGAGRFSMARACFAEDGRKMILPSFGAFTGGLCVTEPMFDNLFEGVPRTYALGRDRVYRIEPIRREG